jgi:hypothetical protein
VEVGMKLFWGLGVFACLICSACASQKIASVSTESHQMYVLKIVRQSPNLTSENRKLASSEAVQDRKTVLVKKCLSQQKKCDIGGASLEYDSFIKKLQKKIAVESFVSQQVSLLELQWAHLRLDREALQQEVQEFDKNLKMNKMSSLKNVTDNIRRLRASVVLEIAEIEQKIALTEKDLKALQSPGLKNQSVSQRVQRDVQKMLQLLESEESFGQSLPYKDNLIAQAIDSLVSEMM